MHMCHNLSNSGIRIVSTRETVMGETEVVGVLEMVGETVRVKSGVCIFTCSVRTGWLPENRDRGLLPQ